MRIFLLVAAAVPIHVIYAWGNVVSDEPTLLELNDEVRMVAMEADAAYYAECSR